MVKRSRQQLVRFNLVSDIFAIGLSFHIAFWFRFYSHFISSPKGIPEYVNYIIILPLLIFVHLIYFSYQGFYKLRLRRNRLDDLFLVILNSFISAFIILLVLSYLRSYNIIGFEIARSFLFIYVLVVPFSIFYSRLIIFRAFKKVFFKKNGVSRILIAGDGELALLTAKKLEKYSHFGIELSGFLSKNKRANVLGNYRELDRVVKKYHITDLFIALPLKEYDTIMELIEQGNNLLVDIKLVPDILQIASLKAGMDHIEGIPIINLGDIPLQGWRLFLKRVFDLIFSSVGLILLSPFFLGIAGLIKIDSRGAVFYKQTRLGLDGKFFKMIKFRTMIADAEKETGAIWSPPNDKRITRIGGFLRKFSLDELPQLINVFKGNMSLVGPRPERPELVEKFKGNVPKYMLRHKVKTGMTGWAQVHGLRGNTPLDKRIEFDIYYIQNWTFRLDLEILWRTVLKFQFINKND